ncbi:queuosine 5'-phosphate N-glycosylase/hydrolase [Euwallacea similis]|uniref:queuosine 5'-phosphate N-glycosylase/hydrolase n=1 Tax=Euwallacea similis TaxID=1736056 RepID=UPI00344EEDAC
MPLFPKESAKYIAENSSNVTIKFEGITKLGDVLLNELNSGHLKPENFGQTEVHPKAKDKHALDWLFVVDTLNFCFWHNEGEEGWKVEGYSGYYALCAAINRALKENIDILNPKFYSSLTEAQLKNILRSDTKVKVPLLSERVKCLHEVGTALLENFEGTFEIVVKQSENSAKKLLELIVNNFKCFQDVATYKNQEVAYYKRAQILVGDIWACFRGQGLGYFKDLDEITMFADYRVPQTLLWYGVIEYGEYINKKLKENYVFHNGDIEEQEIRGCSIHAVELLKVYVNEKLKDKKINSILIDHFLWDFRRKHANEIEKKGLPFHKVFCIYY